MKFYSHIMYYIIGSGILLIIIIGVIVWYYCHKKNTNNIHQVEIIQPRQYMTVYSLPSHIIPVYHP